MMDDGTHAISRSAQQLVLCWDVPTLAISLRLLARFRYHGRLDKRPSLSRACRRIRAFPLRMQAKSSAKNLVHTHCEYNSTTTAVRSKSLECL